MSKTQIIVAIILVDFLAFTGWTIYSEGVVAALGFVTEHLWNTQIAIDLVLSCGFVILWMAHDCKRRGVNPWPWVAVTVVTGSLGWLTYLLTRPADLPLFGGVQAKTGS